MYHIYNFFPPLNTEVKVQMRTAIKGEWLEISKMEERGRQD